MEYHLCPARGYHLTTCSRFGRECAQTEPVFSRCFGMPPSAQQQTRDLSLASRAANVQRDCHRAGPDDQRIPYFMVQQDFGGPLDAVLPQIRSVYHPYTMARQDENERDVQILSSRLSGFRSGFVFMLLRKSHLLNALGGLEMIARNLAT